MEKWLNSVLFLFTILVTPFSIQCFSITLSAITIESPASQCITDRLRTQFLTWTFAVDTMIVSEYGDNICATRLVFRGNCPGHLLPVLLPFRCPSTPSPHLSYSDSYNSAQFSDFTTRPMYSFPSVSLRSTPPTSPFIRCFATPSGISRVGSDLAIIDTAHPPPEPTLHTSSDLFDGWFSIPFLDRDCITHVRSPRLSEIFKLYNLPTSAIQSLSRLPGLIARSICLHIFPFHTAHALASSIIDNTISPACNLVNGSLIPISNCFILRLAPTRST